jgi:uncharacterized protein
MPTATSVAHRFYDALAATDADALLGLLAEDFEGVVSAGMPHGVGGPHHGPLDMLGVWATIDSIYDIAVEPREYLTVSDQRVVVVGHYRGRAKADDAVVDAAFAHVIDTEGDRMTALHQITDTASWGIPQPD